MNPPSLLFPTMRYRDAPRAIEWLVDVLDFQKHVVYGEGDFVAHAQLKISNGMIMVSSWKQGPFDKLLKIPSDIEGYNTQSCYIYLDNLEEHYKKVRDKGVEIVIPMVTEEHGSSYVVRDPEGYIWSFGDYNPYAPIE